MYSYVSLYMYTLVYAKNISFFMLYRNKNNIQLTTGVRIGSCKWRRGQIFTIYTSKLLGFFKWDFFFFYLKGENNN